MRLPESLGLDGLARILGVKSQGQIYPQDHPQELISESGQIYRITDLLEAILRRLPEPPDHR